MSTSNTDEIKPKSTKNFWWPEITDLESAKKVAYYGVWAALINAGLTTLFVILSFFGVNLFNTNALTLIDVAIFLIIAFGIYKLNRIAAVAGLLFYLFEIVVTILTVGSSIGILGVVLLFLYINSIRGTFAYQKFKTEKT